MKLNIRKLGDVEPGHMIRVNYRFWSGLGFALSGGKNAGLVGLIMEMDEPAFVYRSFPLDYECMDFGSDRVLDLGAAGAGSPRPGHFIKTNDAFGLVLSPSRHQGGSGLRAFDLRAGTEFAVADAEGVVLHWKLWGEAADLEQEYIQPILSFEFGE